MASYSTHSLCNVFPSGGQKISSKGNRYFMQPIEIFSHIDERGQMQFIKESFYCEQPLPEGYAMVRFENNPKGLPQLIVSFKIEKEKYMDYVKVLTTGLPKFKQQPKRDDKHSDEKVFPDLTPETRMEDLIAQNNGYDEYEKPSLGRLS